MRTRVFSVLLATVAFFMFSACPGRDTPPPVDTPPDGPPQQQEATPRLLGLASFTGEMLRRGAGERTTEQIAEEIEYVGGDLSVTTETDYTAVEIRVLRDHLELAMGLLADLAQRPTFPVEEIERLRSRELDRLSMMQSEPRWLARRGFYRYLYGDSHPYGHSDADPESISRINRDHLIAFHQANYVPRNSFLVAVGDVGAAELQGLSNRFFAGWEDRPAPELELPPAASRSEREVFVIHVPGSTQAQISVGNIALQRNDPDYLRLRVANQVLGGSASARLFMNLRERCSYSYGVYSGVNALVGPAPISAGGAVEAQHTAGALREIFGEIERLRAAVAPANELDAAQDYMVGYFPIITETADNLAELVTIQRVFGLPDTYWDTYRSEIAAVTADQALEVSREYLRPEEALVVIVGDADLVSEPARRWGPVTVVNPDGQVIRELEAAAGQWPGGEPPLCPELPSRDEQSRREQPPAPATARDLEFPPVQESSLPNGLTLMAIERRQLPLVYLRLVVRSGAASDPL